MEKNLENSDHFDSSSTHNTNLNWLKMFKYILLSLVFLSFVISVIVFSPGFIFLDVKPKSHR